MRTNREVQSPRQRVIVVTFRTIAEADAWDEAGQPLDLLWRHVVHESYPQPSARPGLTPVDKPVTDIGDQP